MFMDLQKAVVILGLVALAVMTRDTSSARESSAALLRAGLPGEDPALVDALASELKTAGYVVSEIDGVGLCDPSVLGAEKFDLLVLPNSASLPSRSMPAIEGYLKGGGDIIALNAPLWQRSLIKEGDRWLTREEYQRENASSLPANTLLDFTPDDIADWHRASDAMESPSVYETVADGPGPGMRALHSQVSNLTSWDTFGSQALSKPFPDGHTLTVFSAKGGPNTTQLVVEWAEKDGSRWIATVALFPEWHQYVLTPDQFKFWISVPNRGGRGDEFNPANAERMSVGLAFTHMGHTPGAHEYWVGPFGTAPVTPEYEEILGAFDPPALDTLSPGYKFFEPSDVASIRVRQDQAIIPADLQIPMPDAVRSPHPRPRGAGFDKGRDWRWIPLLELRSARGEWRGTPATLMIHADGPYEGGAWASFGIGDMDWYKGPAALTMIRRVAERMRTPIWMVDGGTRFYTYFEGQEWTPGVRVVNFTDERHTDVSAKVAFASPEDHLETMSLSCVLDLQPGQLLSQQTGNVKGPIPDEGREVNAYLYYQNKLIDKVSHDIHMWKPKEKKEFVTVKDGDFMLGGKRWRAHGINYMPSSGIGTEDGQYFEHYLSARSYDPEVFQRDLEHVRDLGYNSISIFIYTGHEKAQNLLDILRRCENLGLKVNLSLRPGTPMDFLWPQIGDIIKNARLMDNDTVFAYDLAWEPSFGHHDDRVIWDGEWEKWVVERYGSIENAERDWGFSIPRDESGKVTNPLPHQVDTDGEWRVMTAAYRRFLDTLLYKKYSAARRLVRSVDPNHLVSFRMSEAANPNYRWDGRIPYDFPYLAAAVDFLAPEAYGRISSVWERVRPGWFEFEYARWAAPEKPMIWAEQGVSAWEMGRMRSAPEKLQFQAEFYDVFYEMLIKSGADGLFSWWYPGGFRVGENSDFGVINPDGTDRAVSRVIRVNARPYLDGPSSRPIDFWIEIDRDAHPDGIAGIYDKAQAKFWAAIDKGFAPGLRTAGTGADSSNCPPLAVGNTPWNGTNPPKFLDAAFDSVQIKGLDGEWIEVDKRGTVKLSGREPAYMRIEFTNLGEAKLLAPRKQVQAGGVDLVARIGDATLRIPLPSDVPHLGSAVIEDIQLPINLKSRTEVTLTFEARNRTPFGEHFTFTLEPAVSDK